MWLVLDIGNSAVKGGWFDGERLTRTFRLALQPQAPAEAWIAALHAELAGGGPVVRAGIASVVPPVTAALQTALRQAAGFSAEVVHHAMQLPFRLAYETPHTLGTDRLAAAAAAWVRYGRDAEERPRHVLALDAGTAVTFEVIRREGLYAGGSIAPGPRLMQYALHRDTAQLPEVPLDVPVQPVGRSTREALQAGIMYGFVDAVGGMLARLGRVLDAPPYVVATGGWAPLLHAQLPGIDHVDPHLVLHGIRLLMAMNPPAP